MDELNSYEIGLHLEIEKLEEREAELEVALRRLVTAVEDGCFCSEMEMATRIDEARAALKGKDDG